MVEVTHYPDATVISVWPFDTLEERAQWLERFKEATTDFILAAERDRAKAAKAKIFTQDSSGKSNNKEDSKHGN